MLQTELFSKLNDIENVKIIDFASGPVVLNSVALRLTPFNISHQILNDADLSSSKHWNMISVHHGGKFNKEKLLQGLYDITKNDLLVPYAYREGLEFDYFLIFNQASSLKKLIEAGLRIEVEGQQIPLVVKAKVAVVGNEQKKLSEEVIHTVVERINMCGTTGDEQVLDLSNFALLMQKRDIDFSLKNMCCLKLLCDQLNGIYKLKTSFRVFKFANNNISTLEPFSSMFGFKMDILDLSNNQFPLVDMHYLKSFSIKHLITSLNENTSMHKLLNDMLPTIVKINDFQFNARFALTGDSKKAQAKPVFRSGNGIGNDPIKQPTEGILFRSDGRKPNHDFSHLKTIFSQYRDDSSWSKVTIHSGGLHSWEEILDEIVPMFMNNPFYPCYHKRFASHDEFYLYKNFEVLKTLMASNLEYIIPSSNNKLVFSIRLNVAPFQDGQVDWFYKMNHVLSKRIKDSILDLNDFVKDPDFEKMTICINSKYTWETILEQVKRQNNQIFRINARRNDIKSLMGLHSLSSFAKLLILDFRCNKIDDLTGISMTTNVKELLLDENPICMKFSNPRDYISSVKKFFNQLEWLDGYHINKSLDLTTLQNYLVKREAYTFAEEFVKTFFNIYDSFERHRLLELYNEKSFFTLSINYDSDRNQNTRQEDIFSRVQKYTKLSRNVATISTFSRFSDNCRIGIESIRKVFEDLPKTTHDFTSLCIDVPLYENHKAIITVSGVFSESGHSLNESNFLLGFVRTFIIHLQTGSESTYTISNDQMFIHNPSESQKNEAVTSDKYLEFQKLFEKNCIDLMPTKFEEERMKQIVFRELTELKEEECIHQLDQSFYDIKVALVTFNTLMDSRDMGNQRFDFK